MPTATRRARLMREALRRVLAVNPLCINFKSNGRACSPKDTGMRACWTCHVRDVVEPGSRRA